VTEAVTDRPPSAWPVPTGVAKPAPFATADDLIGAMIEVVIARAGATVLERWQAGWREPGAIAERVARLLAARRLPPEAARWRADATTRADLLARRIGATAVTAATDGDAPLLTALAAWELDAIDRDVVAGLLAFELSPLAAALLRHAGDAQADLDDTPLRVAGLAAALPVPSPAIALDRVAGALAPLALATLAEDGAAATRWRVRADRRWLPLVAGRRAFDDAAAGLRVHAADVTALATLPPSTVGALRTALVRRAAGAPLIAVDAPLDAVALALAIDGRTALVADATARVAVIAREARLLDAAVIVDGAAAPADLAALVAHPIPVAILGAAPAGVPCRRVYVPGVVHVATV